MHQTLDSDKYERYRESLTTNCLDGEILGQDFEIIGQEELKCLGFKKFRDQYDICCKIQELSAQQ